MAKPATFLLAHGGGFCKETWEPIVRRLRESPLLQGAAASDFVSFDFPYHGSKRDESVAPVLDLSNPTSPRVQHPARDLTAWTSAEVLRQVQRLRDCNRASTPLIGIGHSMGACALWNTEVQHPGTFDGLVLFEPVFDGKGLEKVTDFLVSLTLQRESSWPSRKAAEEHLQELKNFSAWDRESLAAYMKGALVEDESVGTTVLACSPAIEASLYCHDVLRFTDAQLALPQCKVFFHSGERTKMFYPPTFKAIVEKWPHVYLMGTPIAGCSHVMVLENPAKSAEMILESLALMEGFRQEESASALPGVSMI